MIMDKDNLRKTFGGAWPWLLCLLLDALLLGGAWLWGYHGGKEAARKETRAAATVRVDTVRVPMPAPSAERPVRVVTVPVVRAGSLPSPQEPTIPEGGILLLPDSALRGDTCGSADTLTARVPVTQKEYRDSDYTAWVSGFMPRLDSIRVYRRTAVVTQTVTKHRRLNVGLTGGAGYGLLTRKPDVWVGVGATLDLFGR